MKKETPEQAAFRKQMEAVESVLSTAQGARLPTGTDFHYYKTFSSFSEPLQSMRKQVEKILLKFPGAREKDAETLQDPDDAFDWMVGLMDDTLARVDKAVDDANLALREDQTTVFQAAHAALHAIPKNAGQVSGKRAGQIDRQRKQDEWLIAQSAAGDSLRPQSLFEEPVDNSNAAFKGKLGHWKEYQQAGNKAPARLSAHLKSLGLQQGADQPPHPLAELLDTIEYPAWQLELQEPQPFKGLDNAPLTFVETLDQLREMAAKMEGARELAVDLENHSFRSFQGFCCLMQLSTREEDFVVDVLKLRSHMGPVLAPFFADPNVVKVLHGADWDVLWLQRDFGIYIANLFDTGQALRVLEHPQFGLGYMLEHFCQIKTDKRYQLADWRTRPLPAEMMLYARMDTHYLLYMYDRLKVELAQAGDQMPPHLTTGIPPQRAHSALGLVLERSRLLCLKRYDVERFTEDSWMDAYRKFREPQNLDPRQLAVFAGLFAWRDRTARQRDESKDYVLSRRQLLNLARKLPRTPKDLRKALMGDKTPSLVVPCCDEILDIIATSLEQVDVETETVTISPALPRDLPSAAVENPGGAQPTQPVQDSPIPGLGVSPQPSPACASAPPQQESPAPILHAGLRLPSQATTVARRSAPVGTADSAAGGRPPSAAGGTAAAASQPPNTSAAAPLSASELRPNPSVAGPAGAFVLKPKTVAPPAAKGGGLFGAGGGLAPKQLSAPKAIASALGGLFGGRVAPPTAVNAQRGEMEGRGAAGGLSGTVEGAARMNPAAAASGIENSATVKMLDLVGAARQTDPPRPSVAGQQSGQGSTPISLVQEPLSQPSSSGPALPSAASVTPAAQPAQPAKVKQKASALGGLFGARAPQKTSVLGGMFGSGRASILPADVGAGNVMNEVQSPQESGLGIEAAQQLRAQFTLPFLAAPAADPDTGKAATTPGGEDARPLDPVKVSGADIRAVVDSLRAENAEQEGAAASGATASSLQEAAAAKESGQSQWWQDDFLPLPILERFPKPHKRPRQEAGVEANAAVVSKLDQGDGEDEEGSSGSEEADDALKETGLVSSSENGDDLDEAASAPKRSRGASLASEGGEAPRGGHRLLGPIFPRASPGSDDEPADSEDAAASADEANAMEMDEGNYKIKWGSRNVTPVPGPVRENQSPAPGAAGHPTAQSLESAEPSTSEQQAEEIEGRAAGKAAQQHAKKEAESAAAASDPLGGEDFVPFDYEGARKRAPGLDLGLAGAEQNSHGREGRGRGGRIGRGRGEKGRAGKKEAPTVGGSFNPYRMQETQLMRGGKRTSTMPRSGNRNMTFGS